MDFGKKLITWYKKNKRELPWRDTTDPYKVWLSEVILQQTRVEQGTGYYRKFINQFPNVKLLASADEDEVLKLWQGLGYYSRARNLHAAAKHVVEKLNGKFPTTYKEIKSLKGIGQYTAAAIASFSFGLPYAVVDGNVYRVLSRVFGIETPIDTAAGKKEFQLLADELLNKNNPGEYNQAIMEFGAIFCKPNNPDCNNCIFSINCQAFEKNIVQKLPVKQKKLKQKNRYFNYIIFKHNNGIWLEKRTGKGIWQHLYQFPLIETKQPADLKKLSELVEWKQLVNVEEVMKVESVSNEPAHILSHQKIHPQFIELMGPPKESNKLIFVPEDKIEEFAVPRLIDKFLSKMAL